MALPRNHRLVLDKTSLSLFRKRGKKVATPLLSAYCLKGENRFAVVIGSHISKKAVVRNRLRRQVHEAILSSLPALSKIDMVLFPKKQMASLSRDEVAKEVTSFLKKAHI